MITNQLFTTTRKLEKAMTITLADQERAIRLNFEDRLKSAIKDHNRFKKQSATREIVLLAEKLFELDSTGFWSVFRDFDGSLNTLEGLERFANFVGNFVDDSYFRLEEDLKARQLWKETRKTVEEAIPRLKGQDSEYEPEYYIVWSHDDHEGNLNYKQLIMFLKKEIVKAKKRNNFYKEIELRRQKKESLK